MKIYKSKIDWWLMVIVFIPFLLMLIEGIREKDVKILVIAVLVIGFVLLLFWSIKYKIEDNILTVWYTKIKITNIKKIYKTRSPLSSPALSIDRIAIVYNKYDEVLVSPKDKVQFIDDLVKVNPNIEVKI